MNLTRSSAQPLSKTDLSSTSLDPQIRGGQASGQTDLGIKFYICNTEKVKCVNDENIKIFDRVFFVAQLISKLFFPVLLSNATC